MLADEFDVDRGPVTTPADLEVARAESRLCPTCGRAVTGKASKIYCSPGCRTAAFAEREPVRYLGEQRIVDALTRLTDVDLRDLLRRVMIARADNELRGRFRLRWRA